MRYNIIIEIEGKKPTPSQLANAVTLAEETVLEAIDYKVSFINSYSMKSKEGK